MERGWHRAVTARERLGAGHVLLGRTPPGGPSPGSVGDGGRGWAFEGRTVGRICGKVAGAGVLKASGCECGMLLAGLGCGREAQRAGV